MSQTKFNKEGFTLIELLVAVFMIGVAMVAIFAALNANIRIATSIKNNYTASLLAQEGIEVVRNLRDSDWQNGNAFGSFGGAGIAADGIYSVAHNSTFLENNPNVLMKYDSISGLFSYSGTDTIFSRRIEICSQIGTCVNSAEERMIKITVSWKEYGNNRNLLAEDHLFNWK